MTRTRKRKADDEDYFGLDSEPEPSPTLLPTQLCWSGDNARRKDLLWWIDHFDGIGKLNEDKMLVTLKAVIAEAFGKPVKALYTFLEFTTKNKFPDLAWQAACWNTAVARMGYEVPAAMCRIPKLRHPDSDEL